jgi:hypothetical protein
MLQQMVQRHAKLCATIRAVAEDRRARDGNPRAQAKLEAKIKSLGALETGLIPGKRGRYELRIHSFAGWDPQRNAVIKPGDPIPEKPWICTMLYVVRGEGQHRISHGSSSSPVLFLTHHSLSRSAQRWGVRTVADLSAAIQEIPTVLKYCSNTLPIAPPDHLVRPMLIPGSPQTNHEGLGATPGSTPGSIPRPKACACRCREARM